MQIYLLKDLAGKGKAGEIISVNDGYGKNFLIKNGIGKAVDNTVLTQVKSKQDAAAFHKAGEISSIKAICGALQRVTITVPVKIGENGKMFGSVTGYEIVSELAKQGFNIEKKSLVFEQIKDIGTYTIKAKFAYSLEAQFTLEVVNGNAS